MLQSDPLKMLAAIIRTMGGNFRVLNWLVTQMERIVERNLLGQVTKAVVETARESLVVGRRHSARTLRIDPKSDSLKALFLGNVQSMIALQATPILISC